MPRTSRSVAQRLAAQQSAKSKKRRAPRPAEAAPADSSVSVDQILDEVVPSEAGPRTASTPTLAPAGAAAGTLRAPGRRPGTLGRAGARQSTRPAVVRRRYSEYAEEYKYVWADLQRIVVVAVVLIALLVGLSFVIR